MSLIDKIHTYSLIAMGISAFLFTLCFLGLLWGVVFYASSIEDKALVVGLEEIQTDDGVLYAPAFNFRGTDGNEYHVQSTHASFPPRYKIGETIKVRYKGTDPASAKPSNFFSLWGLPTVIGAMGTLIFVIGFLVERISSRKRRFTEPVTCADRC